MWANFACFDCLIKQIVWCKCKRIHCLRTEVNFKYCHNCKSIIEIKDNVLERDPVQPFLCKHPHTSFGLLRDIVFRINVHTERLRIASMCPDCTQSNGNQSVIKR